MAKRGRKRRSGIKREPNGRASRVIGQAGDPREVVLNARMRHYQVPLETAKADRMGFPLERLRLWEKITESEYEAGLEFERVLRAFVPMLKSISPEAKAGLKVKPMAELLVSTPPDRVRNVEERAELFMEELAKLDRGTVSRGRTVSAIVWSVCMAHEECGGLCELVRLKEGLQTIHDATQSSRKAA